VRADAWVRGTPAIVAALALSVTGVLMFKVLPLLVGAAADQFHLGPRELGLLASSDLVGITIASLLAPLWVRRVDWRKAGLLALAIVAAGNVASAFAPSLTVLLGLRVFTGLGEGMASGLALVILSDTRHPDRAFALAVAAPILVGLLAFQAMPPLAQAWGYDGVVLALAGLAVAFALLMPALPARGRPVPARNGGRDATPGTSAAPPSRATGPLVAIALLAALLYHVGLGAVWAFVERMGVAAGFAPASIGATLGIAVLFGFAGASLAAVAGARFGRLWPIALAVVGQCAALLLLREPMTHVGFAVAACAFQFLWLLSVPYQLGIIAQADTGGRLFVLALAFQAGGVAVGPVLGGLLLDGDGFGPVRVLTAVTLLASLVLYVPVVRALARREDTSPADALGATPPARAPAP
jgi:predicted MFS family arabinose efflux permease